MFAISIIGLLPVKLFGQAPAISYTSLQTYIAGTAITPPASSGLMCPLIAVLLLLGQDLIKLVERQLTVPVMFMLPTLSMAR
jgi:hypothetical protein